MQTNTTRKVAFFILVLWILGFPALAAQISRIKTFSDGEILTASDLNAEFNNVVDGVNSITDDNVASNAAISPAKIATSIAGDGLGRNGSTGVLSVTVDDSTLEISADTVQVKDGGITLDKLATSTINSLMPTGSLIPYAGSTAPDGWLLCSGGTIGNPASSATLRANADTETLYTLLWNSFPNTTLAIQDSAGTPTTRGASAAADFAANKRMPLPDLRGRVPAGDDNMGGSAASRLTGTVMTPDGNTLGGTGGTQTHTLTSAQMPSHSHTVNDPGHSHTLNDYDVALSGAGVAIRTGQTNSVDDLNPVDSATTGITLSNTGSGQAHLNTQPTILLSYIIKL